MNQNKLLAKAISLAAAAHEEQLDKAGKAYILHPLRLLMRLRTNDAELMQMAVLHDVVEDTHWTLENLEKKGFSIRVLNALYLLTHRKEVTYSTYIKNIAENKDAIRIKLEDLRDNSDITRLKGVSEKDFKRMEKYHKAYTFLRKKLQEFSLKYYIVGRDLNNKLQRFECTEAKNSILRMLHSSAHTMSSSYKTLALQRFILQEKNVILKYPIWVLLV